MSHYGQHLQPLDNVPLRTTSTAVRQCPTTDNILHFVLAFCQHTFKWQNTLRVGTGALPSVHRKNPPHLYYKLPLKIIVYPTAVNDAEEIK